MKKWPNIFLLIFVLLIGQTSVYATPTYISEICGDGLDNDNSNGGGWGIATIGPATGDATCTGVIDADHDGINTDGTLGSGGTTDIDCDDNNSKIYPGEFTTFGCSGGQFHKCQANGNYTSCTSTYTCEATASGACFFANPSTGNNANAGTIGSPWKDLTNISGSCASNCHTPTPGDIFLLRTGTITTNSLSAGNHILYVNGHSGTSTDHIKLMSFPGEMGILNSQNTSGSEGGQIQLETLSYWDIDGIKILGPGFGVGIFMDTVTHIDIGRSWVEGIRGSSCNNIAGIYATASENVRIHHNVVHDVKDSAACGLQQGYGIILFANGSGGNYRVDHSILFAENVADQGHAVWHKHGNNTADTLEVDNNIIYNYGVVDAIDTSQAHSSIHNNLLLNNPGGGIRFYGDPGGPSYLTDINFIRNTLVDTHPAFSSTEFNLLTGGSGDLTVSNNVVKDTSANYGGNSGLVFIDPYSSNALFTTWDPRILFSGNLYWNASVAGLTGAFDYWNTGESFGASYNFTNWKGTAGKDTSGSYEEDSALATGSFLATSTHSSGKGWIDAIGGVPTPTPAPGGTGFGFGKKDRVLNSGRF